MAKRNAERPLDKSLVLNRYILSLLGYKPGNIDKDDPLPSLSKDLNERSMEEFRDDGHTKYFYHFENEITDREIEDQLPRYDLNIVKHWKSITEKRNREGHILYPKYFQYLALLFTEIYMDRYFANPKNLLNRLEEFRKKYYSFYVREEYTLEDLNMIAFWAATGSGKTLIMHVNLLQFQHYAKQYGKDKYIDRVILLTPNKGLSTQHVDEFLLSGIDASFMEKDQTQPGLGKGIHVEVIEITSISDKGGPETVAVSSFEGRNLVLVDEGHIGMTGDSWVKKRRQMCAQGFSMEYSATFGQAIGKDYRRSEYGTYAKSILFDYSYKYFYKDGYGKEYSILNLTHINNPDFNNHYLTAALASFHQQMRLFETNREDTATFNIEKPLWIFIGNTVIEKTSGLRKNETATVSDVISVVLFLANFLEKPDEYTSYLKNFLDGRPDVFDTNGNDIFSGILTALPTFGFGNDTQGYYRDILEKVFNTGENGKLHVDYLKGESGELVLKVGENGSPFGVINVGDATELKKQLETNQELVVEEKEFTESYFYGVNKSGSQINMAIGSRKFIEGWNSWRVSSIGLMNMGKSEGPRIIQLFGRGVRLKGYQFSLKRSTALEDVSERKPQLRPLETLHIFGMRANYMQEFQNYLEEEGLPVDKKFEEIPVPVKDNDNIPKSVHRELKVPVTPKEYTKTRFRKETRLRLKEIPEFITRNPVDLDWYPRMEVILSEGMEKGAPGKGNEVWFKDIHVDLMDLDKLYLDLQEYKFEKAMYNLDFYRDDIDTLLRDNTWYRLKAPERVMTPSRFEYVRYWQEMALHLLQRYAERMYNNNLNHGGA